MIKGTEMPEEKRKHTPAIEDPVPLPLPAELTADWIVAKLMAIASADFSAIIELDRWKFPTINIEKLTPHMRLAIQEIQSSSTNQGKKIVIKPADKLKALDMLAKYKDMFKDSLSLDVSDNLIEKLQAGRGRMNKGVAKALKGSDGLVRIKTEKEA